MWSSRENIKNFSQGSLATERYTGREVRPGQGMLLGKETGGGGGVPWQMILPSESKGSKRLALERWELGKNLAWGAHRAMGQTPFLAGSGFPCTDWVPPPSLNPNPDPESTF